jgi:hypothetical protein
MSLFTIIVTLVLEQIHALPVDSAVRRPMARLASFLEDKFNDGGRGHGALAWASAPRCRPRCFRWLTPCCCTTSPSPPFCSASPRST